MDSSIITESPGKPAAASWQVPVVCVGLVLLVVIVFGQTLGHPFIDLDDNEYIFQNPVVQQGITGEGIKWAFTTFTGANWHPLTWLSHMLDCQLYGLRPFGHHLTNVILQAVNSVLLFLLLRSLTGSIWRCAFVAAIFAIHPLRVESVAWVAERKDLLSGFFFILTLAAYSAHARDAAKKAFYFLALALFVLGLMCKPMLVTVPFVLLLLDFWPLQRSAPLRKLILEKIPFVVFSIASCAITVLSQQRTIRGADDFPLLVRLCNAVSSCMTYLGEMVWPAKLGVFYPYPIFGVSLINALIMAAVLAVISYDVWKYRKAEPWRFTGWFWFLIMLLPTLGLVQVGEQAHADRYTYLPGIGIALALAWMVSTWRFNGRALAGIGVVVIGALTACAVKQTTYWRSDTALWEHTLATTTNNYCGHYYYGNSLRDTRHYPEAIAQYRASLKIKSSFVPAELALGNLLLQQGNTSEGAALIRKSQENFAGQKKAAAGKAAMKAGNWDDAIVYFRKALEENPGLAEAHYELAQAYLKKGRTADANAEMHKMQQINSGFARRFVVLGDQFLNQGRFREAEAQYQQALQIMPNDPAISVDLAWVLATAPESSLRNGPLAVKLASTANGATAGQNPVVLQTLAAADAEVGRFNDAIAAIKQALRLVADKNDPRLIAEFNTELAGYQVGRAYRIPVAPAAR